MKVLNREGIIRMGGRSQGGGGVSIGGGSGSVAGLASEAWVEENYLSKAFFNRLFCVYNANDEVIEPNDPDEEEVIDNIKALVGLWTDQYLTALGQGSGGGGGGGITLNEPLASINNLGAPTGTNKVLLWNGSSWGYSSITAGSVTSVALAMPTGFTVTNTPITSTGTLTVNFGGTVTKNYVLASPASADGAPSWRALVSADIPDLSSIYAKVETVYTKTEADAKFMTIAAFENLFNALNSSNQKVSHPYSSSVASIKALVGLWTEQYISALGQSSGGGGGGVTLNQPLSAINSAGLSAPSTNGSVLVYSGGAWKYSSAAGIFATAITVAGTATAAGFSATGKDNTYVLLAGGGTKLLSEIGGGGGSVNTITINSDATVYSPDANGNVNLPIGFSTLTGSMSETQLNAAINNLSIAASTPTGDDYFIAQYAGGGTTTTTYHRRSISKLAEYVRSTITSSTITTALGFTPVSSSDLADYLPKSGGTMTGTLFMTVGIGIQASNNQGLLIYKPASGWGGISNTQWGVGSLDVQGVIRSNNNDLIHRKDSSNYKIYDASNIDTANAGSATKLETARTLWGQSFDGSANVSGNLSSVGNVYLNNACYIYCKTTDNSDNLALGVNSDNQFFVGFGPAHQGCDSYIDGKNLYLRYSTSRSTGILLNSSGNVGIGTTSPSVKLHVVGKAIFSDSTNPYINLLCGSSNWYVQSMSDGMYIGCTSSKSLYVDANGNISTASGDGRYVQIGAIRLVYDSTNNAIKVVKSDGTTAANFYATGGVSALGNSSSSSSYLDQATADARYLKLSGGQTMTGSFSGTSITLSSQMKSTYAIASSNMTVGTSSLNTSYTLYVNGTGRIGGLVLGNTESVNNVTCDVIATSSSHGIYIKTSTAPNYVDGTWTSASDIRLKDIISNVGASIEQIASAPVFNYRWKAGGSQVMLGTSAQHWRKVFQFGVTEGPNTYLFMDYGATALAAAVITARTVQNHEQRIAALEALSDRQGKEIVSLRAENERLINEINELKAA